MDLTPEAYANRPTRAEVSISALKHNFNIARLMTGPRVKIMAVVKANGYGHGLVRAAETFLEAGAASLGVAYLEEAIALRKNGIKAPILVMGAINTEQVPAFIDYGIDITTSSIDKSRAISAAACAMNKTAVVHMKVDTGMERIGVHWYNAEKFIDETFSLENIEVRGIFSHLAKAESDPEFTALQLDRFEAIVNSLDRENRLPEQVHLANSAGILYHPGSHFSAVRPGLMLYGYNPAGYRPGERFKGEELVPAMSLKTKVSYFKSVPGDTGVSYNHRYRTKETTRIVTLPLGYGDGYRRDLSNRGRVIIRNKSYGVAGTVCMDQIMVDIGADGTAYNGDDALLFGKSGNDYLPLEELCDAVGTIPYEFLCTIGSRVPRIYLE